MAFTFRLAAHGAYLSQEVVNVWHFHEDGAATLADLYNSWMAQVADSYAACLNAGWTGTTVKIVRTDTNELYENGLDLTGGIVGAGMPPQVTGLISWRSGIATRSGRGRTYMPAVDEGQVTNGVVQPQLTTFYGAFGAAMLNWTMAELVIYHRGSGTYLPVKSYVVRDYTYTQRRRAIGRGT